MFPQTTPSFISRSCGTFVLGLTCLFCATPSVKGQAIEQISVSDTEITITPTEGTQGVHEVVALEPYDSYQSSRNWILGGSSNGAILDFEREEALKIRFQANQAAFDPQFVNVSDPIDANRVRHLTIRAKIENYEGNFPATVFIFGPGGFSTGDFQFVADGEWHFARFDLSTISGPVTWSGLKSIRIDFLNNLGIAGFEDAELFIDWIAVTDQPDFTNPLTWSRWERFWDLGYPIPVATLSGASPITIPRDSDEGDLYYKKFLMLDEGVPVGSPQWVSDFSGLSFRTVTDHGFAPAGNGAGPIMVEDGVLRMSYETASGPFDPQLVNPNREIDGSRCKHVHVRVRLLNYQGAESLLEATVFSTAGGVSRSDADFDPVGDWQVLHFDFSQVPSWQGFENLRLDIPNSTSAQSDFDGATLEIDWIAVTKDANYDPTSDLDGYELRYDFEIDRLQTNLIELKGRKGIEDIVGEEIAALDPEVTKLNFTVNELLDLSPTPRVRWDVDGISFGINPQRFDNLHERVTEYGREGINTYMVMLNLSNAALVNDQNWPFIDIRSSDQSPNNLYAFNASDAYGLRYTRAIFEYIAHRMSQPGVTSFDHWIHGNELDAHWFWHNLGEIAPQDFIESFSIEFRQAALVLAQYHPEYRVLLSHTNHWTNSASPGNPNRAFSSKELIDELNEIWTAGGNFAWEVASHPYPENIFDPRFWLYSNSLLDFETPRLSYLNLEVLSEYFEQPALLFQGEPRPISLTEQGFHTPNLDAPGFNPDGLDGERLQAASWAYHWHRFKRIPGIKADITHRYTDNLGEGGLFLGLIRDASGSPKLASDVFAAALEPDWQTEFDVYLPLLPFDSFDDFSSLPAWTTLDILFDESGFTEGMRSLNNVSSLSQNGEGALAGIISGPFPQVGNPHCFIYLKEGSRLFIRLKVDSGTQLDFFWATQENDFYSDDRRLTIDTIADGEFHLYELPVDNHPEWDNQLMTQFRIEPSNSVSGSFEIDYLATGFPDSDGDGVSDADERLWGRNEHVAEDPTANADGDPYTDIEEMLLGTDPDDPQSFFQQELMLDEILDGEVVTSSFVGRPGRTYSLQSSLDLGLTDAWKVEAAVTPASEGPVEIQLPASNELQMFYRYLVE